MTEDDRKELEEAELLVLADAQAASPAEPAPVVVDYATAKLILDLAYWGLGAVKENEEADSQMFSQHESALNRYGKLVNK